MKKLILGVAALMALTFVACEDEVDPTLFTVGFDANGGTYISPQFVEDGDTVIMPENPDFENATFVGWYLNDSAYSFSSIVMEDITLVAKWIITDGKMRIDGFEDVLLNDNGLAQNDSITGSIPSGNLNVSCTWSSSAWGTFGSGFSISNHKDISTAGFTNPYSSSAANGAYQSENFAVCNGTSDSIKFNTAVDLESVMLCNNTYAYLSMLNGDQFTRKFTSDSSDYFMLTLELFDASNSSLGSEDFYLADFRDGKEVIVNEWTKLDLSTFKGVSYIKFALESTDVGDWGMNTPAYFCIDNIAYYEAE